MSDDAHFRLRIPRYLKEWVEQCAKENNRSINAEIISCLQRAKVDRDLQEKKSVTSLEEMVKEAVRPFREEMNNEFEKMKSDLKSFLEDRRG